MNEYEMILKMLADSIGLSYVHMTIEHGETTNEVFLKQEIYSGDSVKEKEIIQIFPTISYEEHHILNIMKDNITIGIEKERERAQALELKKKRDQILRQNFTKEELELMEIY